MKHKELSKDECYYSVISYIPDRVLNERVNVGVVAISGEQTHFRWVSNLKRAAAIGPHTALELTIEVLRFMEWFTWSDQDWRNMKLDGNGFLCLWEFDYCALPVEETVKAMADLYLAGSPA